MDCTPVQRNRRQEAQKARKRKTLCRAILKRFSFFDNMIAAKEPKEHMDRSLNSSPFPFCVFCVFCGEFI